MASSYRFDTSTLHVSALIVRAPMQPARRMDAPRSGEWGGLAEDFADEMEKLLLRFWGDRTDRIVKAYEVALQRRTDAIDSVPGVGQLLSGFEAWWTTQNGAEVVDGNLRKMAGFVDSTVARQYETVIGIKPRAAGPQADKVLEDASKRTIRLMKDVFPDQMRKMSELVLEGFEAGMDARQLGDLIQQRVHIGTRRARFVARNEMGNLYGAMTKSRHEELGITKYVWRTSQDERVRETHAAHAGKEFSWDDPPPETGHPGEDYNCRCTAEPVIDPDEVFGEEIGKQTEEYLPELREQAGLSRAALAKEAGISPNVLANIEKGISNAKIEDLGKLRTVLERKGIPADVLEEAFGEIKTITPAPVSAAAVAKVAEEIVREEPPKAVGGFPTDADFDLLEELPTNLGGSTGAKLVRDPRTGRKYVLKYGNNPAHIAEEALTNDLYRVMGVDVPESVYYPDRKATLAEYVEGLKTLGSDAKSIKMAQDGFAADALLANWDVAGLSLDNILKAPDGRVIRIDNGAGLRFRAMGDPKGAAFNAHLEDLWTLRDPRFNREAVQIFGAAPGVGKSPVKALSYDRILDQSQGILAKRDEILATIRASSVVDKDELERIMEARLNTLEEFVEDSLDMRTDGWGEDYVDGFHRSRSQLRAYELDEAMPSAITPTSGGSTSDWSMDNLINTRSDNYSEGKIRFVDENGKEFDDLRGSSGIMSRYQKFLQDKVFAKDFRTPNPELGDAAYQLHQVWSSEQGGDSWNAKPIAIKRWIADNRKDANRYWAGDSEKSSKRVLKNFVEEIGSHIPDPPPGVMMADWVQQWQDEWQRGEAAMTAGGLTKRDVFDRTMQTYHAFNFEMLKKADIPTKAPNGKTMTVVRTENTSEVLRRYNMGNLGAEGEIIRGANESSSMFQSFYFQGDSVVLTEVPLHRVFGTYAPSKGANNNMMFLGDSENEAVVVFEGLKSKTMMLYDDKLPMSEWEKFRQGQYMQSGPATERRLKTRTTPSPKAPASTSAVSSLTDYQQGLVDAAIAEGVIGSAGDLATLTPKQLDSFLSKIEGAFAKGGSAIDAKLSAAIKNKINASKATAPVTAPAVVKPLPDNAKKAIDKVSTNLVLNADQEADIAYAYTSGILTEVDILNIPQVLSYAEMDQLLKGLSMAKTYSSTKPWEVMSVDLKLKLGGKVTPAKLAAVEFAEDYGFGGKGAMALAEAVDAKVITKEQIEEAATASDEIINEMMESIQTAYDAGALSTFQLSDKVKKAIEPF